MKNGRKIRWWMLIYTLAIGLLFVLAEVSSHHKPKLYYGIAYDILESIGVILLFTGNFLYVFGYVPPLLRKLWKLSFPLIIASFVVGGLVHIYFDSTYQKDGPVIHIVTSILMLGIFFASFRANFLIGYGDVDRVRTIARPSVMSEDPMRDVLIEIRKLRRSTQAAWSVTIALIAVFVVMAYFQIHFESKTDSWPAVYKLSNQSRYDEALTIAERLIAKEPDNPYTRVIMGNLQLAAGRLNSAENSFARAYELLPNEFNASMLNSVRARIDETGSSPTPAVSP
jgi:tetratricopeptide (TPR) repeat protein